ncbi:MAG: YigZ family protein [Clostridiales bacterium]|nr:YigZ family protein [Clostridiales bacterium]
MSEIAYKTLREEGYGEFVIQKSRFIGYASPMQTQEDALEYIRIIKEKHRDASHHCYAYVIGSNAGIMRYQDDGEPTGTAGQPIMEVIKTKSLVNTCVVVVRYFGGTLLGTGGLARSYSHAAALAVDSAKEVTMEPSVRLSLTIPYTIWDKLQHQLLNLPVQMGQAQYTHQVRLPLVLRAQEQTDIEKSIADLSDGRVQSAELERLYYAWPSA